MPAKNETEFLAGTNCFFDVKLSVVRKNNVPLHRENWGAFQSAEIRPVEPDTVSTVVGIFNVCYTVAFIAIESFYFSISLSVAYTIAC